MKKFLVVGGLTLILLATIFGCIYGGSFLPDVKKAMSTLLKEGLEISSESPKTAQKLGDKFVSKMFFDGRMSSSHSHAALFGIVSLVIGQYVARFKLPRWVLWSACWMLLLGGLILPVGIFIEIWKVKAGALMAMSGGSMFIISIIIFLIGAIRSSDLSDEQT